PSRRKRKKRSQNCGANTRALVSSTGEREGRKFGRHWRLLKRFLLELLPMRSHRNAPMTHCAGVNWRISLRPSGLSLNRELAATDDLAHTFASDLVSSR